MPAALRAASGSASRPVEPRRADRRPDAGSPAVDRARRRTSSRSRAVSWAASRAGTSRARYTASASIARVSTTMAE